jgi:hypothetical protein
MIKRITLHHDGSSADANNIVLFNGSHVTASNTKMEDAIRDALFTITE